ncbi:MAG: type 1 glutamine amidotransferase-like domain-containing protein [Eubacterium sp.]|nr:type 1 glutamine amidotransferase-like domain-containing protein [Eubacterium sp.]
MINILLEGYEINVPWLYDDLKKYILPGYSVAVMAFSFRDSEVITGGRPDRMMDRIKEFDLVDILRKHNRIVMGYSAGAVIQLSEYHLSPDKDYKEFQYYDGLGYLDDFYLEVHYEKRKVQNKAIHRVLSERGKTVYATAFMAGGVIVDNGNVKLLGDVKTFNK